MEEEISIINNETRKERVINFLKNNKKKLISFLCILILLPFSYFSYQIGITEMILKLQFLEQ